MQIEEIIKLAVSAALYLYLLTLKPRFWDLLPVSWIAGTILVMISNVATVAETFILFDLLNLIEHLTMTLASALFLIGSFHYGRDNKT